MSHAPAAARLSGDEVRALRFAANRQLARLAKKPTLSPEQHARRNALKRAVAALHHEAFADGCDLYAPQPGQRP